MNATARRSTSSRTRTRTRTRTEREPSDMAIEMLTRILRGLSIRWPLGVREQQVLFHFLFGRSPEQVGQRLGLRETTVHKHLHRVYAKTKTSDRRELIDLGLELARQHGVVGSTVAPEALPTLLRAA